jgi:hypothetical protein
MAPVGGLQGWGESRVPGGGPLRRWDAGEPARRVVERLERVRVTGPGRWMARCPAHADRNPSLSLREAPDGRVLVKCHAGCRTEAVVAALGLEMTDLFPKRTSGGSRRGASTAGGPASPSSRRSWSDYDRIVPPDGLWPAYGEIVEFIRQERAAGRERQRAADRPVRLEHRIAREQASGTAEPGRRDPRAEGPQ